MLDKMPTSPTWVCICCYVLLVNGDGCDCPKGDHSEGLLSQFVDMEVTPGMTWEEHERDCERYKACGQFELIPGDYDCDCEHNSFSWSPCGGCGSELGGERYAVTGWTPVPLPKGLRLSILTDAHHSPNGGLSARVKFVTLVEFDGKPLPKNAQVFPPSADAPAVRINRRQIYGEYLTAYPMNTDGAWFMASGAYLTTSDARYREITGMSYPVPLHDRTE